MNPRLHLLILMLFSSACNSNKPNDQTGISQDTWSYFGEVIPPNEESFQVHEAAAMIEQFGSAAGLFEAEIVQSCKTIGCWMTVKGPHVDTVHVFMKDHAFFVPKDSIQGKKTYFYGEAFYDTLSVNLQKHFLEDAGATLMEIDAVNVPAHQLIFEAAGVMIADVPEGAPMASDK